MYGTQNSQSADRSGYQGAIAQQYMDDSKPQELSPLKHALVRLHSILSTIEAHNEHLRTLDIRLHGPVPPATGNDQVVSKNEISRGVVHDIHEACELLEMRLQVQSQIIGSVERVA